MNSPIILKYHVSKFDSNDPLSQGTPFSLVLQLTASTSFASNSCAPWMWASWVRSGFRDRDNHCMHSPILTPPIHVGILTISGPGRREISYRERQSCRKASLNFRRTGTGYYTRLLESAACQWHPGAIFRLDAIRRPHRYFWDRHSRRQYSITVHEIIRG